MRLFIALDLPVEVRNEAAAVQQRLQRAEAAPVRWARAEGLHLTLQFLGETAETQVAPLLAALNALPAPTFSLRLERAGCFPDVRRPRVIFLGLGGELHALHQLQLAVLAASATLGFAAEERAFHPHITLGRVKPEARPAQLTALGRAIEALPPPPPLHWLAVPPALYRSTSAPGGSIYERLGSSI